MAGLLSPRLRAIVVHDLVTAATAAFATWQAAGSPVTRAGVVAAALVGAKALLRLLVEVPAKDTSFSAE